MKIVAPHPSSPDATRPGGPDGDERTRDRVCEELLERGPSTAGQLAAALGLTPAAVRRHLDALADVGVVAIWAEPPGMHRGRGRPARRFVITDTGHAAMQTAYDDLATAALAYLERSGGSEAVREFAAERVAGLEARYRPVVEAAGPNRRSKVAALAEALSAEGYAASSRPVRARTGSGTGAAGTQLCQGHCPVQQVAARFTQLCEAETEAFSRLLGVHVQRLSTLAQGGHVCTTYVPDAPEAYRPGTIPTAPTPTPTRQSPTTQSPTTQSPTTAADKERTSS